MVEITSDTLARLKELASKATPGLWTAEDFTVAPATEKSPAVHTKKVRPIQHRVLGSLDAVDANYIAAANPQTLLSLIAENERLRKALADSCDEQRHEHWSCERAERAESSLRTARREALEEAAKAVQALMEERNRYFERACAAGSNDLAHLDLVRITELCTALNAIRALAHQDTDTTEGEGR